MFILRAEKLLSCGWGGNACPNSDTVHTRQRPTYISSSSAVTVASGDLPTG